jgi:pimeloyl-ACP methyl ester carboxylesterase
MPVVDRRGVSFHVQLLGEGPPLAMLHGLLVGSMATWYFAAAPRLARRHRVMLHDLRGHGLSSHAKAGYDLATLEGDLAELLPLAGAGRATLVGHSFGALVALRYAMRHPDAVARLVLVDAPLPPSNLPELASFAGQSAEQLLGLLPAAARTGRRTLGQLARLLGDSALLTELAAEPDLDDAALAKLALPVRLVYGDRSGCLPAGERLARVIPGARLSTLPGGHFLPAEQPVALAALLEALVDEAPGG